MVRSVSRNGGILLLAFLSAACKASAPPPSNAADVPRATPDPVPELVLTAPGGAQVWFGDARESRDSSGTTCRERTLEIRGPAGRRIVPLLYTLDTPTVLDDSTIRARLFTDCRPGPAYRIDLRTGLPTRKDR